jgi:hypothetical protein
MIVVRVELHSAVTGNVTTLGIMHISNKGTHSNPKWGNFYARVFRKGTTSTLRECDIDDYPKASYNMWRLVIRALLGCFPEERIK